MAEEKFCLCCQRPVRIMTETDYCSARCRRGKCGHIRLGPVVVKP